jgi:uncharacterized protein (DUF983 family)
MSIRRGDELGLARCTRCANGYVFDLLTLPRSMCPSCLLVESRRGVTFAALPHAG